MSGIKRFIIQKRLLFLVAFFSILLGFLLGALTSTKTVVVKNGTPDNPAAISSVGLMVDYGNGIVRTWNTVSWHESMSVLDLIEQVATAENIPIETELTDGKRSIRSIDGITNTASERWKFWLNNTFEPRVAEKAYLRPGDLVIYIFAKE